MKERRKIKNHFSAPLLLISLLPLLGLVKLHGGVENPVVLKVCGKKEWILIDRRDVKDGMMIDCNGMIKGMVAGREALVFGMKMDLNRAECGDFTYVPGVGATLAERICTLRKKKGKFSRMDELLEVKGVGTKKLETIKKFVEIR